MPTVIKRRPDNTSENSSKKQKTPGNNSSEKTTDVTKKTTEMLQNFAKLDTNEKFYNLEDEIAAKMTHEKILEEYMKESVVIRKCLTDYIEGKKIEKNMVANVAKLRRLARLCHYATMQLKKQTNERLNLVDEKVLQLQNCSSEVQHIQKEINRCLDFSAGDEDLDLVDIDEFYEKAPETMSKPHITKTDEHQQYLARLEFEAEQRRQMQSTLQELEGRRNVLASDIRGKEQRLQSLKPKIENLVKAAAPVHDILGVKYVENETCLEQRQLSFSLPPPLAVAHIHSLAYKELMDDKHFSIKINGTAEEAARYAKKVKDDVDNKSKHRSKEEDNVQKRVDEAADRIFDTHPMNIDISVECPSDLLTVVLRLQYVTELKVVAMKWSVEDGSILSEETLLSDLFENDNGETCPNVVGQLKLKHLKLTMDMVAKKIGRPYKFLQSLAGESEQSETQLIDLMRNLTKAIRQRVKERKELQEFVESLHSKKTKILDSDDLPIKLSLFKQCDEEKFSASMPSSLSKILSNTDATERIPFRAEFEDLEKKNKLTAWISIPCSFPRNPPLFGLSMVGQKNDESFLRQAEDQLNDIKQIGIEVFKKQLVNIAHQFDLMASSTTE